MLPCPHMSHSHHRTPTGLAAEKSVCPASNFKLEHFHSVSAQEMATLMDPPRIHSGTFRGDWDYSSSYSVTCAITATSGCKSSLPANNNNNPPLLRSHMEIRVSELQAALQYSQPKQPPSRSHVRRNASLYEWHPIHGQMLPGQCPLLCLQWQQRQRALLLGVFRQIKRCFHPLYHFGRHPLSDLLLRAFDRTLEVERTPRMRDILTYFASRKARNIRRHRQQDELREKRLEELVTIEANRVRREKRRHVLTLHEMDRQKQLATIVEDSKDLQNQRLARRFMVELALKAAKREEELNASGQHIKVIETSITENGKVVGTKQEYLREWYAETDADAQKLLDEVGGDLQQTYAPHRDNVSSGSNAANTA
ncbi:hypothetical protein BJ741DRAFT_695177 [Chytriomyces cf. hyalinus JEL632]|nr:hypothetical protein BJ741DRAFT_695177 [Chytriomyces cf. hyalinus JEL632]